VIVRQTIKRSLIALAVSTALGSTLGLSAAAADVPWNFGRNLIASVHERAQDIKFAAFTAVGSATSSSNTVSIPSHQAGDIIVIWAVQGGAATAPSLGAGYRSILTKTQAGSPAIGARLGIRVATSTSDTSGTWTNANEMCCQVYRPQIGYVARIGQSASSSSTTATVTFPALTLADGGGNSWILGFLGVSNLVQTMNAPTGMTSVSPVQGASYEACGYDTQAGTSSWSVQTVNSGSAGQSVSATVELVLAPAYTSCPNIYSVIGGGGNANTGSNPGNNYKFKTPKPTGAGNTWVLFVTYDHDSGQTISSISGAANGSFGSARATVTGGAGHLDTVAYALPNLGTAGTDEITITFTGTVTVIQLCFVEVYGVAASPINSSTGTAAYSTSTATASFTPDNNDATGGNLIITYFAKADLTPTHITTDIFADSASTLLVADIGWANATDSVTKAMTGFVQTSHAAITPSITSVAESGDHWNCIALALKVQAGAGTSPPTGIQINKFDHFTTRHYPAASASNNFTLQCPCSGNLRAIGCTDQALSSSTIVRDNEGVQWSLAGNTPPDVSIWYRLNTPPNANLEVTIDGGGGDIGLSWRFMDAYAPSVTWSYETGIALNDDLSGGVTTYTPASKPSPLTTNPTLIFANIGLGAGPGLAVTAPSGAVWDLCTYTGEVDSDEMENADIMCHYVAMATGAITFTYTITGQSSNNSSGGYALFVATPLPVYSGPPCVVPTVVRTH